jgi:hypothetical protein
MPPNNGPFAFLFMFLDLAPTLAISSTTEPLHVLLSLSIAHSLSSSYRHLFPSNVLAPLTVILNKAALPHYFPSLLFIFFSSHEV